MKAKVYRRLAQAGVFAVFLFLFLNTEYKDNDILPYAVNIFLRLDPLMAGAATLASRTLIPLLWPSLVLLGLTLLFGRFFCGWLCPLGSILDLTSFAIGKKRRPGAPKGFRNVKFAILALLAGSALFTLQLVFLFDPLCLLIRSFTLSVFPAANYALNALFGSLYETKASAVTAVSEPVYSFLKNHFLSFEQQYFQLAALTGFIFLGVLGLEFIERRFWCRNLCPLGALLGICGKHSLLKRRVSESACTSCSA
jgi:polyferredoxin